jgi:hypothetical protein
MLMFGQPCDDSGISAYGNYRHVGPLTASRDRGYRCALRVELGTDAASRAARFVLCQSLLPSALNQTTMKVLIGILVERRIS